VGITRLTTFLAAFCLNSLAADGSPKLSIIFYGTTDNGEKGHHGWDKPPAQKCLHPACPSNVTQQDT
jgi:hypothetical protein